MRTRVGLAMCWLLASGAGLILPGCADPDPNGPSFEVSFDSSLARSEGGEPARVELYLVLDCDDVSLGERSFPPMVPRAMTVRDGPSRPFGPGLRFGDFGLYGVAQDEDCAVVAAACTPVTIDENTEDLAITLSRFDVPGCAEGEVCALEAGRCEDGSGGTGGSAGTGGSGGSGRGGAGGSSLSRVTDGLVALYDFDEGSGATVFDQSGIEPALDLTIDNTDNVAWSTDSLTTLDPGAKLQTGEAASRLYSAIAPANAMTMEAWVRPSTLAPTGVAPDRIVSMSIDNGHRNFLLGQSETEYAARYRTEGEDNGNPTVASGLATATLSLTHVVFTHASDGSEVFYIDGTPNGTSSRTGGTSSWNATYPLVVANEANSARPWLGELHLVAIYDRALTAEEVEQNYQVGP